MFVLPVPRVRATLLYHPIVITLSSPHVPICLLSSLIPLFLLLFFRSHPQLAYVFFLVMFTYTVLVKMHMTPNWQEVYSIAYITALGCEKIREIISSEPVAITCVSPALCPRGL